MHVKLKSGKFQQSQRHTFNREFYWPGGPVRMETKWPSEQDTGPTGTLVVICIIFYSRYFFNQALTVNLLIRLKLKYWFALIFMVASQGTLI